MKSNGLSVGRLPILADLQGPKLRIGKFAAGKVNLKTGDEFVFDRNTADGDEKRVNLPHPELFDVMSGRSFHFHG